jgi:hypothetical protein
MMPRLFNEQPKLFNKRAAIQRKDNTGYCSTAVQNRLKYSVEVGGPLVQAQHNSQAPCRLVAAVNTPEKKG